MRPDLEQVHDLREKNSGEQIGSRGVTPEELVQAFKGWTVFTEELVGFKDFLNEARTRETYPYWF